MAAPQNILIIGGGFAGLSAVRALRSAGPGVRVELIDPGPRRAFLPLLPDVVGRGFRPDWLEEPYAALAARWGFHHRAATAVAMDRANGRVATSDGDRVAYDALIVAAGSQTTFYGRDALRPHAFCLDTVADAVRLAELAREAAPDETFVVVGAGYTGAETATHLAAARRRVGARTTVILTEITDRLCGALPDPFQRYLRQQLEAGGVVFAPSTRVLEAAADAVVLSDGRRIRPARLVWTAGVTTPPVVASLGLPVNRQGRLVVDACLTAGERVFAAGDAAAFTHRGQVLRMSVQFAISEGARAAKNALSVVRGASPRPFRPVDPGYVVPLGNGRGCGLVMGRPVYGRLPVALHYLMCAYRTPGAGRKLRILAAACR